MNWKYSAHGNSFHGKSHEEISCICKKAGFQGIELKAGTFGFAAERDWEKIKKTYENLEISIATFHLPFTLDDDLSSFYEAERIKAVDNARTWMLISKKLGAGTGIIHPVNKKIEITATEAEIEKYFARLSKSLHELLPVAEDISLKIAIENSLNKPGFEHRFCSQPEHIRMIQRELGHPNLGFCYDTGHALVSARDRALEILDAMSDKLFAVHLHDNAGDRDSHLAPGKGLADWDKIFKKIQKCRFSGFATIEAPPFSHGPDYSEAAWKELLSETRKIAEKALKHNCVQ